MNQRIDKPLLSICIPTYNRASYLVVALKFWVEEIVKVDNGLIELIIGDNASADATEDIMTIYTKFPFVTYVRNTNNLGCNGNILNILENHAKGKFVWICGDDDFLAKDALTKITQILLKEKDINYFYINSSFLQSQDFFNLGPNDPRTSNKLKYTNKSFTSGIKNSIAEIIPLDIACLSGLYASIWKREDARNAFGDVSLQEMETLEGTLPHACYLIRNRMHEKCYYFGEPLLTVSHTVSWQAFSALFNLKWMLDLYDLLEKNGIKKKILDEHRKKRIKRSGRQLLFLLTKTNSEYVKSFSLQEFILRNRRFFGTYTSLFKTFVYLIKQSFASRKEV